MDTDEIYRHLFQEMGDLGWWPGESPDEVLIGTILTQNTSWRNVEMALSELRHSGKLSLDSISGMETVKLSDLIRSSGFHNQKAERLKDLSTRIIEKYGTIEMMSLSATDEVIDFLRTIRGIGQETLDSILLYVLDRAVFVIDKYTLRIFSRVGLTASDERHERIKQMVVQDLDGDVSRLKNLHGMLVQLAKNNCRKKPVCSGCPLSSLCRYHREIMLP